MNDDGTPLNGDPRPSAVVGAPRPGRRHLLPTVVLGLSFAVGVALLLWGADRVARWSAERFLERSIAEATGVPTRPSVDVHGTFFLPQVLRGRYDDVEITVHDLTSGPLRIADLHAHLSGVHVSLHDLLVRRPDRVQVEESVEEAFLSYADLNRYLDVTGRPVTVAAGDGGEVSLTATAKVLGRSLSASALAELSVQDGALAVRPTQVDTHSALDPANSLLVRQRLSFLVPLDPLPVGQHLTEVRAVADGLRVQAVGRGVVLRP